ncbi:MAG: hypothetical protein HY343_10760 [Lentisphaerae bacterium]|nr:hypothetical protein [Lentisphaerota bacterium]
MNKNRKALLVYFPGILIVILLVVAVSSLIKARKQSARSAIINNLRQIEWGKDQGETIINVVTNHGDLNGDGISDFMVLEDNQKHKLFGYIFVTGVWIQVHHPGYVKGIPAGKEGDCMFPQRDPAGIPIARDNLLDRIGQTTHIFTNGTWTEYRAADLAK